VKIRVNITEIVRDGICLVELFIQPLQDTMKYERENFIYSKRVNESREREREREREQYARDFCAFSVQTKFVRDKVLVF